MTNLTILEAMNQAKMAQQNIVPEDVAFLMQEELDFTPSQLRLRENIQLTPSQAKLFFENVQRLAAGESPQYIIGHSWFYGLKLEVNPAVLIPRFETEELVQFVLTDLQSELDHTSPVRIIDIGTGSGAISAALLQNATRPIVLTVSDLSPAALEVARRNIARYNHDNRAIDFVEADILTGLAEFDVVVSNPPYIKTTELAEMDSSVINNEPDLALFAGSDGLDFYRAFIKQIDNHLRIGGHFYLEFGFAQKNDLAQLFASELPNYTIEFRKDLSGHDRMVKGTRIK